MPFLGLATYSELTQLRRALMSKIEDAVANLEANETLVKASVDAVIAKVAALADEIKNAPAPVDTDALAARVQAVADELAAEKAAADAAVSPPAA